MAVNSKTTWVRVLGCVGMAVFATALSASDTPVTDSNPYAVISDRNIFHLNPPPPPVPAEAPKPVDLPKVALTGFYGKGTSMKVMLAVLPPKDSKDPIAYLSLAPGDRDHDVQVVRIHSKEVEVDIINSGTAQTLTRSNDLASLGSLPHSGGGGGGGALGERERGIHRPMIPGFTPPPGPGAPVGKTREAGGGSSLVIGGRDSGSTFGGGGAIVSGGGSGGGGYSGQALVGGGVSAAQYANTAAPGNNVGSQLANSLFNPTSGHYQPATPSAPPLPHEVQAALLLGQKASANGSGPPLPPDVQAAADGLENQGGPPPPGNE